MQTLSQQPATSAQGAQPLNQIPPANPLQLIDRTRCILRESWHRVKAYPYAPSYQSKMVIIERLMVACNDAEATLNGAMRCRMLLRLELDLHSLAPSSTIKRRQTYLTKVNDLMAACRLYLGWRAQQ